MSEPTRTCPRCCEPVASAMARCRSCGQMLTRSGVTSVTPTPQFMPTVPDGVSQIAERSIEADSVAIRQAVNASSQLESDTAIGAIDRNTPMPTSVERIRATCSCGTSLRVPKTAQGKRIKCPKCGSGVLVNDGLGVAGERTTKVAQSGDTHVIQIADTVQLKPMAPRVVPVRAGDEPTDQNENDGVQQLQSEIELACKRPAPSDSEASPRKKLSGAKLKKLRQELEVHNVLSDSERIRRRLALLELGRSCDSRVLDDLVQHAEDDAEMIREGALTALGEFGDPQGLPTALKGLCDKNEDVIRAALAAIRKIGDLRVVRPVLRFGIEYPRWRPLANDVLVKLGSRVVNELQTVLQTSDPGLTLDAIVVLGRIGDQQAVASLISCLDHVSDLLRAHVMEALAAIGDPRAVPHMLRALEAQCVAVRANAAAGLVRLADPRSLVPLINALQDEDGDVRRFAAVAIGELGDSKAVPKLIAVINAWEHLVGLDPSFLEAVVEALGKLGDTQAVPRLIPLLQADHDGVLLKVVLALKRLRDPSAASALIGLLSTPNPTFRRRVVETLGHAGDASVVPALGKLLHEDSSPDVRAAAARALGELKAIEACSFLQEALRDDFPIRCQAVISLGTICDQKSLPALMAMLKDEAPEIRYHAINAIAKLREPKTLRALAVMLEDSDQMVCSAAEKAIEQFEEAANNKVVQQIVKRVRSRSLISALIPTWLFALLPRTNGARGIVAAAIACSLLLGFVIKSTIGGPAQATIRGNVQSVVLNGDGSLLVAERTMGMLEVWDVKSQTVRTQASANGSRLLTFGGKERAVLFSGDSLIPWLLSGTPDVSQGWKQHKQPITKFAATPDGKFAATLSKDLVAMTWDLQSGQKKTEAEINELFSEGLAISADGQLLATANRQGDVRVCEADGGKQVNLLQGSRKPIVALAFSPDGNLMVGVEMTGDLLLWDLTNSGDHPPAKIIKSDAPLRTIGLRVLSDSQRVLTVDARGQVRVWDLANEESRVICRSEVEHIDGFSISGDEKRVALGGSSDSAVEIYDIESGELFKTLDVRSRR